jgi:hypothetical protein
VALPYPLDRLAGCICRDQRYMGWMGPSRRGDTVCAVVAIVAWASLLRATTATSASCPYTAYEGVDLNGGDLPNQPASKTLSTLDQCAALCCSMGFPCAAFALNAGSPNSRRLAVARNSTPLASVRLCDHLLATRFHFVRRFPVEAPSSCCLCGSFSRQFFSRTCVSTYLSLRGCPVPLFPFLSSCYLKASSGWTNTSIPGVESGLLTSPPPAPVFPWFNTSLPRDQRLQALVAAMTLEEQISWLDDSCPSIPRLGLPAYSWEAEALHGVSWAGVATVFPEVRGGEGEWLFVCFHLLQCLTCCIWLAHRSWSVNHLHLYLQPIAWGATFDVPLISSIANVVAVEARAK